MRRLSRVRQGRTSRRTDRSRDAHGRREVRSRPRGSRAKRKAITPAFFLFVCVTVAAIGIFTLVQRLYIEQSETAIERTEKMVAEEEANQEKLRVDLAALESPNRISRTAREELGMIEPESFVYLTHKPGSLERLMGYRSKDEGEKVGGGSEGNPEKMDITQENSRLAKGGWREE